MRIRFLGQPFGADSQLGRLLLDRLEDQATQRLWIATAWAKRSGLSRIANSVTVLVGRGGTAEAIIGIDEGGASLEGLQLAAELFRPVHVFHDPGPRTFHPKLYVTESQTTATAIVGSGNLTKGGLFTNYEAAFALELDLASEDDAQTLASLREYYEQLLASGAACQPLDDDLIQHLSEVAVISSESAQNRGLQRRRARRQESVFGTTVTGLAGAPAPQIAPAEEDEADEDVAARIPAPTDEPVGEEQAVLPEPPDVAAIWWKRLSASDAQHPPGAGSAVTGVLRLSKAGHPINWRTYFRRDFFGESEWRPRSVSGRAGEETFVDFAVTVLGRDVGSVTLRIDHAPHREADQDNVPTVLHWGELAPLLHETNYTNHYVILSRYEDGSHALEIARAAPPKIDEP